MKKTVEQWQIDKLFEASNSVRGTKDYTKYLMQMEFKNGKTWSFLGWYYLSRPVNSNVYVKTNPTGDYLYVERNNGDIDRYLLRDEVKEVMCL